MENYFSFCYLLFDLSTELWTWELEWTLKQMPTVNVNFAVQIVQLRFNALKWFNMYVVHV